MSLFADEWKEPKIGLSGNGEENPYENVVTKEEKNGNQHFFFRFPAFQPVITIL